MDNMDIHNGFITDKEKTMSIDLNPYLGGFLYAAVLEDICGIASMTDDQLSRSLIAITTTASLDDIRDHFYKAKLTLLETIVNGDKVGCLVFARGMVQDRVPTRILMELDRIHGIKGAVYPIEKRK